MFLLSAQPQGVTSQKTATLMFTDVTALGYNEFLHIVLILNGSLNMWNGKNHLSVLSSLLCKEIASSSRLLQTADSPSAAIHLAWSSSN